MFIYETINLKVDPTQSCLCNSCMISYLLEATDLEEYLIVVHNEDKLEIN